MPAQRAAGGGADTPLRAGRDRGRPSVSRAPNEVVTFDLHDLQDRLIRFARVLAGLVMLTKRGNGLAKNAAQWPLPVGDLSRASCALLLASAPYLLAMGSRLRKPAMREKRC